MPGQEDVKLEFPPNSASGFRFSVRRNPTIARINTLMGANLNLSNNVLTHIKHEGIQLDEPLLLFSNKAGTYFEKDTHALRGIRDYQPYDYPLNNKGFGNEVHIGIICPPRDSAPLAAYLNGMHNTYKANERDAYVMDFPGFSGAFGLSLNVPQPNQGGWVSCLEPFPGSSNQLGTAELANNICKSIELLQAANSPSVILVYIPKRWESWKRYEANGERFDLHDFVKAYCVTRGICTQFLREETLNSAQDIRIRWWLALSFYVKAKRTPWILESFDRDTAFLGLGFKFDKNASRSEQIILGCSHIYSSDGLGLRYQLSKLEDSIIRNRNPFMSTKDARRTGESVRQLFYESTGGRLPHRVVIHKRTPFSEDERDGLLEGLSGIENVDMIEVNIENSMKYVSIKSLPNGTFDADGYPVKRGTAVVLDSHRALIWVHGSAPAASNPRFNYYLGGNRIPAPLAVIRHHGTTAFPTLAREILGLSKMNWNSFDLYTKLPATIDSSNRIAQIGALLERFGSLSYDYRLFI